MRLHSLSPFNFFCNSFSPPTLRITEAEILVLKTPNVEDCKTVFVPFFLNRQTMGGGHCVHVPTPELHLQYKHSEEEERPTSTVSLAPCFLFSFFLWICRDRGHRSESFRVLWCLA